VITRPLISLPSFPCWVFATESPCEFIHLFLCFLSYDSVAFLDLSDQLISPSADHFEIIVCQLSPLFFYFARILLPFSFQLIPVHRILLDI
jgi:hypothetical protein